MFPFIKKLSKKSSGDVDNASEKNLYIRKLSAPLRQFGGAVNKIRKDIVKKYPFFSIRGGLHQTNNNAQLDESFECLALEDIEYVSVNDESIADDLSSGWQMVFKKEVDPYRLYDSVFARGIQGATRIWYDNNALYIQFDNLSSHNATKLEHEYDFESWDVVSTSGENAECNASSMLPGSRKVVNEASCNEYFNKEIGPVEQGFSEDDLIDDERSKDHFANSMLRIKFYESDSSESDILGMTDTAVVNDHFGHHSLSGHSLISVWPFSLDSFSGHFKNSLFAVGLMQSSCVSNIKDILGRNFYDKVLLFIRRNIDANLFVNSTPEFSCCSGNTVDEYCYDILLLAHSSSDSESEKLSSGEYFNDFSLLEASTSNLESEKFNAPKHDNISSPLKSDNKSETSVYIQDADSGSSIKCTLMPKSKINIFVEQFCTLEGKCCDAAYIIELRFLMLFFLVIEYLMNKDSFIAYANNLELYKQYKVYSIELAIKLTTISNSIYCMLKPPCKELVNKQKLLDHLKYVSGGSSSKLPFFKPVMGELVYIKDVFIMMEQLVCHILGSSLSRELKVEPLHYIFGFYISSPEPSMESKNLFSGKDFFHKVVSSDEELLFTKISSGRCIFHSVLVAIQAFLSAKDYCFMRSLYNKNLDIMFDMIMGALKKFEALGNMQFLSKKLPKKVSEPDANILYLLGHINIKIAANPYIEEEIKLHYKELYEYVIKLERSEIERSENTFIVVAEVHSVDKSVSECVQLL